MNFKEMTQREIEYEKRLAQDYKRKVKTLPGGCLNCKRTESGAEYYLVERKTRKQTYVPKNQENMVDEIKLRKRLEISISILEKNIAAQEKMLMKYQPYEFNNIEKIIPKIYRTQPPPTEEKVHIKDRIRVFDDGVIHLTSFGLKVRSKSEVMIAELLKSKQVEFEYERPLILKNALGENVKIHPDFTFTGRYGDKLYWEHFGLLGTRQYRADVLKKMETYIINGIMPSVRLFMTAESADGSIDAGVIMRTIEMIEKIL